MKKLFVVGLGPGDQKYRTHEATAALEQAELLCGYHVYIDLIAEEFPDKATFTTPMTQEVERCREALEAADGGRVVAMICSGDAGIYGMAGLIYEIAEDYPQVQIEIVSGVTAAIGGSSVLGAPLTNDFVVLSLSNLLTPWETIEKRLHGAGLGDYALCIYNPMSKRRIDHLKKACDILLEYKPENTLCGTVRNIGRNEEEAKLCTLKELRSETVDMFTTVFIGNKDTVNLRGKMVTRRGYHEKYHV